MVIPHMIHYDTSCFIDVVSWCSIWYIILCWYKYQSYHDIMFDTTFCTWYKYHIVSWYDHPCRRPCDILSSHIMIRCHTMIHVSVVLWYNWQAIMRQRSYHDSISWDIGRIMIHYHETEIVSWYDVVDMVVQYHEPEVVTWYNTMRQRPHYTLGVVSNWDWSCERSHGRWYAIILYHIISYWCVITYHREISGASSARAGGGIYELVQKIWWRQWYSV